MFSAPPKLCRFGSAPLLPTLRDWSTISTMPAHTANADVAEAFRCRRSTTFCNTLRTAPMRPCEPPFLITTRCRRHPEGPTKMQPPSDIRLDIGKAGCGSGRGGASGPDEGGCRRHCTAQAASTCTRAQIADALTAILLQAEAIRLRHAAGGTPDIELDLSAQHIIGCAKTVWRVLGDTRRAPCICRNGPP